MLDFAEATVARWPLGSPFTMRPSMQSLTLQVILRSVFGLEEGPLFQPAADLVASALAAAVWPPLLIPAMQKDLGAWSPWGRYLRLAEQTYAVVYEQIRRRRAEGTAGRPDVLSLMIEARDENGEPLSDVELRDHLVTLLVVGHDTTATALAWTFHYLLEYPDTMRALITELDAALADGPLTPERIMSLPYLDATVREGLRLNPVVPLLGRRLIGPRRVGGYDLPAGTALQLSIYLTARREGTFTDAARFEPERYLRSKPAPSEWYPFGGGVRRCIGMAFAIYEMKIVLATVLTRVSLERAAGGGPVRPVRRSITITPSDDVRVVARARQARGAATAA
jgi:cytochrome P450